MNFRLAEDELASLVLAAMTPAERLAGRPPESDAQPPSGLIDEWCQVAALGDRDAFRRMLAWRGLSEASLGDVAAASPAWVPSLSGLLAGAEAASAAPRALPPSRAAGEPLWQPVAEAAIRPVRARLVEMGEDPALAQGLAADLLDAVAHVALPAMWEAGLVQRGPLGWLRQAVPAEQFPRDVLLRYPALGRALAVCCDSWTAAQMEFLDRLAADRDAVAAFLPVPRPAPLSSLKGGSGDLHNGARAVMIVGFADGSSVVYKPHPVALDAAFYGFVGWINRQSGLPDLKCPRVLDRATHGWAEFIPHRPADPDEVSLFWQRAGQLLALGHVLNASDLHYENVIACGGHPVPVDLETILQPCVDFGIREAHEVADAAAWPGMDIAAVGLLPMAQRVVVTDEQEQWADMGALSAPASPRSRHRPGEGAVEADLLAHAGEVAEGAGRMLRFLGARRAELLRTGSPLEAFRGVALRHVFRPTSVYVRLAMLSCSARFMRDGRLRDIALERLARPLLRLTERPAFAPVIDAEKRALNDLDIPYFHTTTDSRDLHDRHGRVAEGMFAAPATTALRQRLAALDEAHIRRQQRIVGLALQARIGAAAPAEAPPGLAERGDALQAALAIGRALGEVAEPAPGGEGCWWHCLQYNPGQDVMLYGGTAAGLGDGAGGIALFLTALAGASDDARIGGWRDGALGVVAVAAELLLAIPRLAARECGLLEGAAGLAYVMVVCGHSLGRAALLGRGVELAACAARACAGEPNNLALSNGLAGVALACQAISGLADVPELNAHLARWQAALAEHAARLGEVGLLQGRAGVALAAGRLARGRRNAAAIALSGLGGIPAASSTLGDGNAGLLLAALAGGEPDLGAQLVAALASLPPSGNDSLVRGNAGLARALRAAAASRSDEVGAMAEAASGRLEATLAARALAASLAPVTPKLAGVTVPGLLNGVAGIGLCLLRSRPCEMPDALGFA
jgi:lantibiotic modifying enzyme